MKIIFSHSTGNQNSRSVGLALLNNNLLARFYTTLGIFSDSYLSKIDNAFFREIKRREYDENLRNKTTFFPKHEVMRLMALKSKSSRLSKYKDSMRMNNLFDISISKDFQKYKANIVYGYPTSSMNTFIKAKNLGIKTIYDLTGCHWRSNNEILLTEKNNNPEWSDTITSLNYSKDFLERCDLELELADHIIVASNFAKNSLDLFPKKLNKVNVIPYGFPEVFENRLYKKSKKLKILFVGSVNQQKGISYLFDAVKSFKNNIELFIVGSLPINIPKRLEDELKKHNYLGTMPHSEVLEVMRESDLLIFPTLIDAYGMVISEAMSQGTPVITTTSSAGPDLITHGENGWVVNASNSEEIETIIESLLVNNNVHEIGHNALLKAKSRPWSAYQFDIVNFINELE